MIRNYFQKYSVLFGLFGLLLSALSVNVADLDMFHEMALFREAIAIGKIPTQDLYSYVPTVNPIIHHEWGTGAFLYFIAISCGLGGTGLIVLKYIVSAGIFYICFLYSKKENVTADVFSLFALSAFVIASIGFRSTIRAHLFSLLFLVILFKFLQKDRLGNKKWVIAWLPLHIVWLNMHAAFVLGFGVIFFQIVERTILIISNQRSFHRALIEVKHLIFLSVAMILATLINPYGIDYIQYLYKGLTLDRSPYISEWRPIWDTVHGSVRSYGIPIFIFYITLLIYSFKKLQFRELPNYLFLSVTAYFSALHIRYLSVFLITWICCVPTYIIKTNIGDALVNFFNERKLSISILWVILGLSGLIVSVQNNFLYLDIPTSTSEFSKKHKTTNKIFPVGAVNYLFDQEFMGNLMVPFSAGSYVSWKLYPDVKVSIDSRFEVAYSVEWATQQIRFYKGEKNWKNTLTRFPTDAVLTPRNSQIEKLLLKNQTDKAILFDQTYKDNDFSIFIRSGFADNFNIIDNTGKVIIGEFP